MYNSNWAFREEASPLKPELTVECALASLEETGLLPGDSFGAGIRLVLKGRLAYPQWLSDRGVGSSLILQARGIAHTDRIGFSCQVNKISVLPSSEVSQATC